MDLNYKDVIVMLLTHRSLIINKKHCLLLSPTRNKTLRLDKT